MMNAERAYKTWRAEWVPESTFTEQQAFEKGFLIAERAYQIRCEQLETFIKTEFPGYFWQTMTVTSVKKTLLEFVGMVRTGQYKRLY